MDIVDAIVIKRPISYKEAENMHEQNIEKLKSDFIKEFNEKFIKAVDDYAKCEKSSIYFSVNADKYASIIRFIISQDIFTESKPTDFIKDLIKDTDYIIYDVLSYRYDHERRHQLPEITYSFGSRDHANKISKISKSCTIL